MPVSPRFLAPTLTHARTSSPAPLAFPNLAPGSLLSTVSHIFTKWRREADRLFQRKPGLPKTTFRSTTSSRFLYVVSSRSSSLNPHVTIGSLGVWRLRVDTGQAQGVCQRSDPPRTDRRHRKRQQREGRQGPGRVASSSCRLS